MTLTFDFLPPKDKPLMHFIKTAQVVNEICCSPVVELRGQHRGTDSPETLDAMYYMGSTTAVGGNLLSSSNSSTGVQRLDFDGL